MSKLAKRIFAAAGDYAALGFHVFPLSPQTKIPLKDSGGLNDASADQEQIYNWWNDYPEANVGINCGASGLVVLDIDVKHGKDARPAVEGKDMRGAPCVQTPSGGLHYYFRADGHKFQSGSNLYGFDGLDVRAEGGYVVAPPSCIIEHTGEQARAYKLVSGSFANIPPVPQWLVDWERKRQEEKRAVDGPAEAQGNSTPVKADEGLLARATKYVAALPPAISGQGGHVATLKAATALVVGFRLSDADALTALQEYNRRCAPAWSTKELSHKIADARKNALNRPWGYLLRHGLPLRNFAFTKDATGKDIHVPRMLTDITSEILTRCDGFPKRLGSRLFDFDEAKRDIVPLETEKAFSAWLQRRGACLIDFRGGHGFPKWSDTFEDLLQTVDVYDAVVRAPFYPERDRMFKLYGQLPTPTPGSTTFWKLLDFMSPASSEDRLLMAAFFIAPLLYGGGAFDRPGWGIDTVDAQASGKTSVVEVCARIYDCVPIALDFASFDRLQSDIKKRLISAEGRSSRIALFDNVAKEMKSSILCDFITAKHFTERAAYGRGEEKRPNDISFCVTFNGGRFDTDLASRFYTLKVKEPEVKVPYWKKRVFDFIDGNRLQLYSDMIALLDSVAQRRKNGEELWTRKDRRARFPEFDSIVLAAVCKSRQEFDTVGEYLTSEMAEANGDADRAERFDAALNTALHTCPGWCEGLPTVLFAADIDALLATNAELLRFRATSRDIRQWVRAGLLPRFDVGFRKIPTAYQTGRETWGKASFLYGVDRFDEHNPDGTVQVFRGDWGRRDGRTSGLVEGTFNMPRFKPKGAV